MRKSKEIIFLAKFKLAFMSFKGLQEKNTIKQILRNHDALDQIFLIRSRFFSLTNFKIKRLLSKIATFSFFASGWFPSSKFFDILLRFEFSS